MRHFKLEHIGLIVVVLVLAPGCATTEAVRYVYQDRDFGVIGMPENTDQWPSHYRRHAEKLMAEHFPEGHEIVRAEEVVEGSRTLKVEGSKTAEIAPQLPAELMKVAKLGSSASRSQSDTLKIKECRIIYRRVPHSETANVEDWGPVKSAAKPPGKGGNRSPKTEAADFADHPAVTPAQYLDPNDLERRKAKKEATESIASTGAPEKNERSELKHVVAKPVVESVAAGE